MWRRRCRARRRGRFSGGTWRRRFSGPPNAPTCGEWKTVFHHWGGATMETTEKIVECYTRYVKGWMTIPNVKCPGQYEIDLLALNPVTLERFHSESGVSVSGRY